MINHVVVRQLPAACMALWKILGIQRDGKHNLCFLEASSIIKKTGTEDEKKIVCYRL